MEAIYNDVNDNDDNNGSDNDTNNFWKWILIFLRMITSGNVLWAFYYNCNPVIVTVLLTGYSHGSWLTNGGLLGSGGGFIIMRI